MSIFEDILKFKLTNFPNSDQYFAVEGVNTAEGLVRKLEEEDSTFGEVQDQRFLRATTTSRWKPNLVKIDQKKDLPLMHGYPGNFVTLDMLHSGGEWCLGETKYIIGDSYTIGKVWATTFGINWRKKWPLGAFWENAKIEFFAPTNYFWGQNKALVWLYLQSWTWFDVTIILGIKFWWFSFFLDPLLLI